MYEWLVYFDQHCLNIHVIIQKKIDISFRCKETYRKKVWRFHSAIRHETLAIWRHQWRWQAQNPSRLQRWTKDILPWRDFINGTRKDERNSRSIFGKGMFDNLLAHKWKILKVHEIYTKKSTFCSYIQLIFSSTFLVLCNTGFLVSKEKNWTSLKMCTM